MRYSQLKRRFVMQMKCIDSTHSLVVVVGLAILLLSTSQQLGVDAGALPSDFSIQYQSIGAELVWTASKSSQLMAGGSRPEFRFTDGTLLGYPREKPSEGLLVMSMTSKEQDLLLTKGQDLEVWYAARRIDNRAPEPNSVSKILSTIVLANMKSTPTVTTDPAALGNYTAKRLNYTVARGLKYFTFPSRIEIVAEVTYPEPLPAQSPLVLFLHGRHGTCYNRRNPKRDYCNFGWPCDRGCSSIPSHLGYRYVADILASQGFITVSISANGINGQDWYAEDGGAEARSLLIRHHLNLWTRWNTMGGDPWQEMFRGKVDLNNVVLVGHSRGGEGVNRAAIDVSATDPYKIVGLVSYGPTAFGSQVTPDIHSATILPACDGDVSDLQGQKYIDRSRDIAYSEALRSAVIVLGANHNYFNTEWTPGLAKAPAFDDWYDSSDPVCGSKVKGAIRLTPKEQQVVGAAYTVALVRLAINQDASMLPLLDGSYVRPASIGRAEVATHFVGGASHRLLYRPEDIEGVQGANGMVIIECRGFYDSYTNLPECYENYYSAPHWLPESILPSPQAAVLKWTNKIGATAIFTIATGLQDLSSLNSLDIRVANDPQRVEGARLEIMIHDNLGRNATLNTSLATIDSWPGSGGLDRVHARALRGYLASVPADTVDLKNVVSISLVALSKSGKVWVLDIAASQAQIKETVDLDLPKISVETKSIAEGNGSQQSLQIQIISDKALTEPGSIWMNQGSFWDTPKGFQVNMTVGSQNTTVSLPFSWVGDSIYSSDSEIPTYLSIGAMKGVVTGNYNGVVQILEDDPFPNITVRQKIKVMEGQSLTWRFKLSAPTAGVRLFCDVLPPASGTELSSDDVPRSWLRALGSYVPLTPEPLSSLGLYTEVSFPYGVTTATLVIPINADMVAETTEQVVLECSYDNFLKRMTLVGIVPAHNTTT
jgi:hypothetical protein